MHLERQPPRAPIRNTDDYLTTRFPNPRTGLVSPSIYVPTPRTPGEALAAFYGDGGAAATLNEYFGLGRRRGGGRPLLRRRWEGGVGGTRVEAQVEDVAEHWRDVRRMLGTLALESNVAEVGRSGHPSVRETRRSNRRSTSSSTAVLPQHKPQVVPGSYDWEQSTALLEGEIPTIRVSEFQDPRLGSTKSFGLPSHSMEDGAAYMATNAHVMFPCDLAQLPPVILVHPSEASIPKLGRLDTELIELPCSTKHPDRLYSLSRTNNYTQILGAAYAVAWTLVSVILMVPGIRQGQLLPGTTLSWKSGCQKLIKHLGTVLRLLCVIYAVFCAWQVMIIALNVAERAWWPIVIVFRVLKWLFGS